MVPFASGATRKRISASRRWARRRWLCGIVAPADNWDKPPSLGHRGRLPAENELANTITNGSWVPNDGIISSFFRSLLSLLRVTTGNWYVRGWKTTYETIYSSQKGGDFRLNYRYRVLEFFKKFLQVILTK